jgi:hypothetical protein
MIDKVALITIKLTLIVDNICYRNSKDYNQTIPMTRKDEKEKKKKKKKIVRTSVT